MVWTTASRAMCVLLCFNIWLPFGLMIPFLTSHYIWHKWFRQQAITWTNIDLDPCRHMTSLDHNELSQVQIVFNVLLLIKMTRPSYGNIANISCYIVALIWAFYFHDCNNLSTIVTKWTRAAVMSCLHHLNFLMRITDAAPSHYRKMY